MAQTSQPPPGLHEVKILGVRGGSYQTARSTLCVFVCVCAWDMHFEIKFLCTVAEQYNTNAMFTHFLSMHRFTGHLKPSQAFSSRLLSFVVFLMPLAQIFLDSFFRLIVNHRDFTYVLRGNLNRKARLNTLNSRIKRAQC